MPDSGPRRLFFALWPPAGLADEIVPRAARLSLGGRLVRPHRLHLTLAFHRVAGSDAVDALIAQASRVGQTGFTLVVDRVGGFAASRTAWFGCTGAPAGLQALAAALSETPAADRGACPGDPASSFVSHITVARDVAGPVVAQALFPPLIWHVGEFCLVESGTAGRPGAYDTLARFRLAPRQV